MQDTARTCMQRCFVLCLYMVWLYVHTDITIQLWLTWGELMAAPLISCQCSGWLHDNP